jgi:hypothetical protein
MNMSEPGFANGINAAADISESIATGPVWSWLDEPQSEAIITGTNDAYRP